MDRKINRQQVNQLRDYMLAHKKSVAVAESVTAGNIQAAISLAPDASLFFQGAITTYNLGNKCRHLHINPIHALECNCVSAIIAEQMAVNVCGLFLSDVGIGITGYASIAPEAGIHEPFAYVSIAAGDLILATKKLIPVDDDPADIQIQYANDAILLMVGVLEQRNNVLDLKKG